MKKDKALLERISAEIDADLASVRQVKAEFKAFSQKYPTPDRFLVRAQASYLEDFYNACEKVFTLIANELNGGVPKGENWHRTLLRDMSIAIGKRPPVVSKELYERLGAYLGFRHLARHLYGFSLDSERLDDLCKAFPAVADYFCREIEHFVAKYLHV
jgi:hypothetical protein